MFKISPKFSNPYQFSKVLGAYMAKTYKGSEEATKFNPFFQSLQQMRETALAPTESKKPDQVIADLKTYLLNLQYLEGRFPFNQPGLQTEFVWYDNVNPARKAEQSRTPSLLLEKYSVLFNLATAYNLKGASIVPNSETEKREARAAFSEAANQFHSLSKHVARDVALMGHCTFDMSTNALDMYALICQAHAHMCAHSIGIEKKTKPVVLAHVASTIADLFMQVRGV
ncbi:hypothetical protein KIPB_005969 [Kipferlia bialata]|uniref:BRO1 domain-containing protein n=1 Tax=Kipferlia bialata TaxID=797122 RepID=A0A9K3CW99_9EUKA|nr:hypothetical protein KIPB_005969 [Kipferlia bialata]|eukprot:g5969.t1